MDGLTLSHQVNQCNSHTNATTLPNQDLRQLPTIKSHIQISFTSKNQTGNYIKPSQRLNDQISTQILN